MVSGYGSALYEERLEGWRRVALQVIVDLQGGTATGTWDGAAFSYRISNIERVRGSRNDG